MKTATKVEEEEGEMLHCNYPWYKCVYFLERGSILEEDTRGRAGLADRLQVVWV
jgi:hypothetical protein